MRTYNRYKALIVDDDPFFGKLLVTMIGVVGWDGELVCSWEHARKRLEADHFDLLLTNYQLKHGNGFHFICCLRRDGIMLPAIVISDNIQVLRLTPKDLLHISAVLQKPFTISELGTALAMVLS